MTLPTSHSTESASAADQPVVLARNLGIRFYVRHQNPTVHSGIVRFLKRQPAPDEFWALRGVSFSVAPGELLGVIGANGSGKSTLLRSLTGIYHPDEGEVSTKGRISSLLTLGAGFHVQLSGIENININATLLGLTSKQLAQRLESKVEFADLGDFIDAPVRTYSSGMRARLGFSIAVHIDPEILVVDEVIGVGDAAFSRRSRAKLEELFEAGTSVVMAQHNMRAIADMCHRVMWLDKGRVQSIGDPATVVNAYLASRGLEPLTTENTTSHGEARSGG